MHGGAPSFRSMPGPGPGEGRAEITSPHRWGQTSTGPSSTLTVMLAHGNKPDERVIFFLAAPSPPLTPAAVTSHPDGLAGGGPASLFLTRRQAHPEAAQSYGPARVHPTSNPRPFLVHTPFGGPRSGRPARSPDGLQAALPLVATGGTASATGAMRGCDLWPA